jgi:hypothetical protein
MLTAEFGIDAKAFCNYFTSFYYAGQPGQAFSLIRAKHFVGTASFKLPLPVKSDPNHHMSFSISSQNDLLKSLGVNTVKISDSYAIKPWLKMKNIINSSQNGWRYTTDYEITPSLYIPNFVLNLSNDFDYNEVLKNGIYS